MRRSASTICRLWASRDAWWARSGAFEAGDGGGERGEFDVALVAGGDRGDRREFFGDGG